MSGFQYLIQSIILFNEKIQLQLMQSIKAVIFQSGISFLCKCC